MRSRRLTTGSMSVSARPRGLRGVALNWQRWPALVRRARRFAVLAAVSALAVPVLVEMAGTAAAVTPGSTASQTILDLTPNPSTSGDSVRMHVRVMDQSASCTGGGACVSPTGFIYFSGFSNSSGNCICIDSSGLAVGPLAYPPPTTPLGRCPRGTACQRGPTAGATTRRRHFRGQPGHRTQVVNKAPATTTLTQSADTTFAGQSVTFTAWWTKWNFRRSGRRPILSGRKPVRPCGRVSCGYNGNASRS